MSLVFIRLAAIVMAAGIAIGGAAGHAAEPPVLKGIVLLADPVQVRKDGIPVMAVAGFVDTRGTPWIDAATLTPKLSPLEGGGVNNIAADMAAKEVTDFHKTVLDEPFVNVYVPPQDATSGIIQIVVQRGVLGQAKVENGQWFSPDSYLRYLPLHPGQPIKMSKVNDGIGAINHGGFRQAQTEAKPGAAPGETDILVKAEERFPVSIRGGYDNTGTPLTSRYRYNIGTTWGNAFGIGHELSYDFSADPDFEYSKSHRFGYYAPLANGDGINLSASYGTTKSKLPEPFDQAGTNKSLSGRYIMPLDNWRPLGFTSTVSGGLDFKRADNQLEFNQISINQTTTDVVQLVLDYNGSRPDGWGATSVQAALFFSPGHVSAFNTDERFDQTREGANARYYYVNGELGRSFDLPEGFGLSHRLAFQFSPYRLIGSEQIAVGGFGSVRGYSESDTTGDYGLVLRNEFLLPTVSLKDLFGTDMPQDRLQFYAFYDIGNARRQEAVAGEDKSITLRGAGVGLNYSMGRYGSFRLDLARGLERSPESGEKGTEIHFGLSLAY